MSNWSDPNDNDYLEAESELLDEGRVFFTEEANARAFAEAFPINSGGHRCRFAGRNREGTYAVLRVRD